jgi:hypothetical protein
MTARATKSAIARVDSSSAVPSNPTHPPAAQNTSETIALDPNTDVTVARGSMPALAREREARRLSNSQPMGVLSLPLRTEFGEADVDFTRPGRRAITEIGMTVKYFTDLQKCRTVPNRERGGAPDRRRKRPSICATMPSTSRWSPLALETKLSCHPATTGPGVCDRLEVTKRHGDGRARTNFERTKTKA